MSSDQPERAPQPHSPADAGSPPVPQVQVTQQPRAQQGMTTTPISELARPTRNPRNSHPTPVGPDGTREWRYGICDCCEAFVHQFVWSANEKQHMRDTCYLACWCPCISYSRSKARLNHLVNHGTRHPVRGVPTCSADCWLYGLLRFCCLGWVLQVSTRRTIRARYNIKGSDCGDCMTGLCCTFCDLYQQSLEIELEENQSR